MLLNRSSKQILVGDSISKRTQIYLFTLWVEWPVTLRKLLASGSIFSIYFMSFAQFIITTVFPLPAFWIIMFLLLLGLIKTSYSSCDKFSKWPFFCCKFYMMITQYPLVLRCRRVFESFLNLFYKLNQTILFIHIYKDSKLFFMSNLFSAFRYFLVIYSFTIKIFIKKYVHLVWSRTYYKITFFHIYIFNQK